MSPATTSGPVPEPVLEALRGLDTPTVCNALEVVAPARRGSGYTVSPLVCAHPRLPPIVGYARTATIRAMQPSGLDGRGVGAARLAYYRHVAEGPGPTITVVEDLDPVPGYGAWWGEVNTHVHRGLGSLGVLTNGSIRDLDVCAEGFQLLAGSIGPSHAHVHVVDVGVAVTVAGMSVRPGDLVHADRHGAVTVPAEVAAQVPEAAADLARAELVLIEASMEPGFGIEVLEGILTRGAGH
ncbi:MAG: RraA family protein [Acidimicrobiia bacterium]|nr:RraA family protein [Acidimicrobiia bacterium]